MDIAPMDHYEKTYLRRAAFRASQLYPGPVGDLCCRELLAWEEFGYRLGGTKPVMQLADHIMRTGSKDVAA